MHRAGHGGVRSLCLMCSLCNDCLGYDFNLKSPIAPLLPTAPAVRERVVLKDPGDSREMGLCISTITLSSRQEVPDQAPISYSFSARVEGGDEDGTKIPPKESSDRTPFYGGKDRTAGQKATVCQHRSDP